MTFEEWDRKSDALLKDVPRRTVKEFRYHFERQILMPLGRGMQMEMSVVLDIPVDDHAFA